MKHLIRLISKFSNKLNFKIRTLITVDSNDLATLQNLKKLRKLKITSG